jgi:hypothetical protein
LITFLHGWRANIVCIRVAFGPFVTRADRPRAGQFFYHRHDQSRSSRENRFLSKWLNGLIV